MACHHHVSLTNITCFAYLLGISLRSTEILVNRLLNFGGFWLKHHHLVCYGLFTNQKFNLVHRFAKLSHTRPKICLLKLHSSLLFFLYFISTTIRKGFLFITIKLFKVSTK